MAEKIMDKKTAQNGDSSDLKPGDADKTSGNGELV